ncbi:MAG: hypothetical protein K5770_13230 [Lachnospiraceae bacterium]|nr:hypothetical protein [Lachnospiraceae bacterium]
MTEKLEFALEYDDADDGRVDMTIRYPGADADPLEEADELSAALLRNSCRTITHTYSDGNNVITAEITETK